LQTKYVILDLETGNSRGTYRDHEIAAECLVSMARQNPKRGNDLALISFDEKGATLATELLEDVARVRS
jgi:hypothetical protein